MAETMIVTKQEPNIENQFVPSKPTTSKIEMPDNKIAMGIIKSEYPYYGSHVVIGCGDINGQFETLFKKILTIHRKLGRIAFALCVGNFFVEGCEEQWARVERGEISPCCHIYVLGPTRSGLVKFYPDTTRMVNLTEKITYLGKSGVFITAEGIRLAYLSGTFSAEANTQPSPIHYSYRHIHSLIESSNFNPRIDILLTSLCPHHFGWIPDTDNFPNSTELPPGFLYDFLMPKYQMATTDKETFEAVRMRYYKGGGGCAGSSRFFGIPSIGKIKWIKALYLTPNIMEQPGEKLIISRIVSLDIPGGHEFWHLVHQLASDNGQVNNVHGRNTNRPRPDARRAAKRRRHHHHRSRKSDKPCWFCLSTCADEEHMVVSVGEHSFMALAKGPIIEDHVLISSLEHRRAVRILSEAAREEIDKFKKALTKFLLPDRVPVFYERACKSSHLQVHCVPIPQFKLEHVVPAIKELAAKYRLEVAEYGNIPMCFMTLPEKKLYFHVELPDGKEVIVAANEEHFPVHFGRELLVMPCLLNLPEKKNWRHCAQSREEETEAANAFKRRFARFDFT